MSPVVFCLLLLVLATVLHSGVVGSQGAGAEADIGDFADIFSVKNLRPKIDCNNNANLPLELPKDQKEESRCFCGLANRSNGGNRIFRGNTTNKNEYPWMVRLMFDNTIICGGSFINSKWVLTAAHCVEDFSIIQVDDLTVVLGDHDATVPNEDTEVEMSISEIIMHPQTQVPQTGDFDFALLKMKGEIDFIKNKYIRPACLPENPSKDYVGWDTTLIGWGYIRTPEPENKTAALAEKLQYISGPVATDQKCRGLVVRDLFPRMLKLFWDNFPSESWNEFPTMSNDFWNEFWNEFPNMSSDFWNDYLQMLDTLQNNFPGISDAFLEKFFVKWNNFRNKFTGMWNIFWNESPWMLKNFQQTFPGMSDEFLKVLSYILGDFLEDWYTGSMLCIDNPGGNACQGDSGGPLVTKPSSADGVSPGQNYELIGATSFGGHANEFCNASAWTIYAKVATILHWIEEQTLKTNHTNCGRE